MVRGLDPGGTSGSGSSSGDDGVDDDAAEELERRDQGSDSGSSDGGGGSSSGSDLGSGITSGSGDVSRGSNTGGSGGGGSSGGSSRDAREQLESRDPGSGDGRSDGGSGGSQDSDPGARPIEDDDGGSSGGSTGGVETDPRGLQPREAAERVVTTTLESGVEQGGVGDPRVREQARSLEQRFIQQSEYAEDRGDVAVRREGDSLVASLSRSAQVELAEGEIEEFTVDFANRDPDRMFSGTERVPLAVGDLDTTDVVLDLTEEGIEGEFNEETKRSIARHQAAQQLEDYDPDDLTVERASDGEGYVARPRATGASGDATGDTQGDGLTGFDRVTAAVDVDAQPIRYNPRATGPHGDEPLLLPPGFDVDVNPGALGLPGRDDARAAAGIAREYADAALSGEFFAAGAMSPGDSEEISEGLPSREAVADETPSAREILSAGDGYFDAGAMSPGSSEEISQNLPSREAVADETPSAREIAGAGAGAARGAGRVVTSGETFAPGALSPGSSDEVSEGLGDTGSESREDARAAAGTAREYTDAALGGELFAPGALSPGESENISRNLPDRNDSRPSRPETPRDAEAFLEDLEAGFPQGVEASGDGPPITEAGGAGFAAGAARGRAADPVRLLVTRSPLSPGRRVRTAGKVVAGGVALGAGALTVEEASERLEEDTGDAAAPVAQLGEIEISDAGQYRSELDVSRPREDVEETAVGDSPTDVSELDVSQPRGDVSELPVSRPREDVEEVPVSEGGDTGTGTGDGEAATPGESESVVPGEYPLPGRDVPRNPREDRSRRVNPREIIGGALGTSPLQKQRRREDELSELLRDFEEAEKRRRRERRRAREEQLWSPGRSRDALDDRARRARELPRVNPSEGFDSLREFPTGGSAVVDRFGRSIEDAEAAEPVEEDALDVSQGQGQQPREQPLLAPLEGEDTATDQAQETAQESRFEQRQETVTEAAEATEAVEATETAQATETAMEVEFLTEGLQQGESPGEIEIKGGLLRPDAEKPRRRPEEEGEFERFFEAPIASARDIAGGELDEQIEAADDPLGSLGDLD